MLTATEAGLRGEPDCTPLTHTYRDGRVLVTYDNDFLGLHAAQPHAGIAYCAQGARTVGQIVDFLVLMHEVLDADEMTGQVQFL